MEPDETDLARESRIDRYDVLGRVPPRDLQTIVDLAARVCDVPSAVVNLITSTEQHQVAAFGFEPSVCAREDSMCATVLQEPPVAVADARQDERFADNPFVTGEVGLVRFYASAPMVTPDGVTVGRLCVFDEVPRTLSAHEQDVLTVLARHAADLLELRLRTNQLESSLTELTRTRDELRRSNDTLTAFAGQVSHDLRSPLTAIIANAELLSEEPVVSSDPELASMATEVIDAGLRMSAMIEDVLAHARVAGELRLTATDLEVLAANVLKDLRPVLRDRGATVRVGRLPTVQADPAQLYLVLLNLVANAAKYSGDRSPNISIGASHEGHTCRIWVRDTGIGIHADRQEDVFQPYARIEQPSGAEVAGSGIGLDTVRRVAEAHGWRLGIDSAPGEGTTVWFELECEPQSAASGT